MAVIEQHNYGDGKNYQVNKSQGPTMVGDGNQMSNYYAAPPPERPRSEQILWEAVREEVEDRLAQSLHNQVLINLGKEAQPQQVNSRRPWDWEVKMGPGVQALTGDLPEEWDIGEIFNRTNRKLLILGAPGSGKTTTLLDLGRVLLKEAATDVHAPIPVLANLSSWKDDEQGIADWLREEVRVNYKEVPKLGQQWLEEKKLLPLLDGLDEVAAERQELCVQRINEWLDSELRPLAIVVCSRTEEYGLYQTNLQLGGSICLKPLTLAQMQDYLRGLGQEALATHVETDAELQDLVKAPLLLEMAVLVFEGRGIAQGHRLMTKEERLTWLLDAYVVKRLQKIYGGKTYQPKRVPSEQQVRIWLSWLAWLLAQQYQTEFLIEGLQPQETLLSRQAQWQFGLIEGLIRGLTLGIVVGLISSINLGWHDGISFGLVVAVLRGPARGLVVPLPVIEPVETFKFPTSKGELKELSKTLADSILLGLLVGLIFGIFFGLTQGLLTGLILGLMMGLIIGLVGGSIVGLRIEFQNRIEANQGIKSSLKNSKILGAIGLLLSLIFYLGLPVLLGLANFPEIENLEAITTSGAILICFLCLNEGGFQSAYQHFALRLVLTFSQHSTPWHYARFLNYCTELTLLQRVGGRYRFIHKLLQDHFATLP